MLNDQRTAYHVMGTSPCNERIDGCKVGTVMETMQLRDAVTKEMKVVLQTVYVQCYCSIWPPGKTRSPSCHLQNVPAFVSITTL